MPDIAMCKGEGCPIRDDCYRYTAKPSEYVQSYFAITPYDKARGCEHYWEMYGQRRTNDRAGSNL